MNPGMLYIVPPAISFVPIHNLTRLQYVQIIPVVQDKFDCSAMVRAYLMGCPALGDDQCAFEFARSHTRSARNRPSGTRDSCASSAVFWGVRDTALQTDDTGIIGVHRFRPIL